MEDLPIVAAIFGSEELLQYSDELLETMTHLRGRRLNIDTKKAIEEVNKFKNYRNKNSKIFKTKNYVNRSKIIKLKKQINKCLKRRLTKKIGKKSPKNKTRHTKK